MMKIVSYLGVGVLFGITMVKSQAASWFRIYEMFMFKSFHMYGIIGVAVVLGVLFMQIIKRRKLKSFYGEPIQVKDKEKGISKNLIGGIIFGLGWALVGACPGPMYVLLGAGFWTISIVILGALLGTFVYGLFKDKLPH